MNSKVNSLIKAIDEKKLASVKTILEYNLEPYDIAKILESISNKDRKSLWRLLDKDKKTEVLNELDEKIASELLADMGSNDIYEQIKEMDDDELADLIMELPDRLMEEVLAKMEIKQRKKLVSIISYDKDSAGGLMNTDYIAIPGNINVETLLRYLRRFELPKNTDQIFVINEQGVLLGKISLLNLITLYKKEDILLSIAEPLDDSFDVSSTKEQILSAFQRTDSIMLPVVDKQSILVGRISIDDVMELIKRQEEEAISMLSSIDEGDSLSAPVIGSALRRNLWLFINLIGTVLSSMVIARHSDILSNHIELTIFLPLISAMGGIAATQSLALAIKAISADAYINVFKILSKQLFIGSVCGLILGGAIYSYVYFNYGYSYVALTLLIAMVMNLSLACLIGVGIPLLLKRMKLDPAIAGSVVLLCTTDMMGYLIFLSVAGVVFAV